MSLLIAVYFKGGYLVFSHLTKLKYIYITEIYTLFTNHQKLGIKKLQEKKQKTNKQEGQDGPGSLT